MKPVGVVHAETGSTLDVAVGYLFSFLGALSQWYETLKKTHWLARKFNSSIIQAVCDMSLPLMY